MAYDATHGFTVQEATNLRVYDSYKCEILTLDGSIIICPNGRMVVVGDPSLIVRI